MCLAIALLQIWFIFSYSEKSCCCWIWSSIYLCYLYYLTPQRPDSLKVDAQDITGAKFELNLTGLPARVFQHEYDHLLVFVLLSRKDKNQAQCKLFDNCPNHGFQVPQLQFCYFLIQNKSKVFQIIKYWSLFQIYFSNEIFQPKCNPKSGKFTHASHVARNPTQYLSPVIQNWKLMWSNEHTVLMLRYILVLSGPFQIITEG